MRKFMIGLFIFNLLTFSVLGLFAQMNTGVLPASSKAGLTVEKVAHEELLPPDLSFLSTKSHTEDNSGPYKVAKVIPVDYNVDNSGTWEKLSNGTSIWRLRMSSEGAKGNIICFDAFDLPFGSQIFVYNSDKSLILGPYTSLDNPNKKGFSIGIVYGDEAIIEYIAPVNRLSAEPIKPNIQISGFSYFYRGVPELGLKDDFNQGSQSCEVNVNCTDGNDWRTQQKGVARIYCEEGGEGSLCTGTLINNTSNDGTPYFLTADHCGGSASDSDFSKWIFFFNYEAATCSSTVDPTPITISGCTKVARGDQSSGSDFLLLKLNTTANNIKNNGFIYNGWDRTESQTMTGGGVGIHHPAGDVKKISTYTDDLSTVKISTGLNNSHWNVTWSTGITEGGSSGSPLFKGSNKYVIGTLTGGLTNCTTYTEDGYNYGPDKPDYYGKMSTHWTENGLTNADQLKPWLDPTNTGATICNYYDPNGSLSVSPASLNFASTASSKTFTVSASTATSTWSATSNQTWLNLSPTSGNGNGTTTVVTATVDANSGTANRTATITITQGSETKNIVVTQSYTGAITYGFTYDFEDCTDFAVDQFPPCTTIDNDGAATWGVEGIDFENEAYTGSYIAFNSDFEDLGLDPFEGDKFGVCFAAKSTNDDWFITPVVHLKSLSSLKFHAKSLTDAYGLERFNVLVSTTDNTPISFTKINTSGYEEAPTTWKECIYDLSSYDNKDIYVAIQCVSDEAFAFMIDDIQITTKDESTPSIIATPTELTFSATGGQKSITVSGNVDWTVSKSCDWITVSTNAGSNNGTILATALPNTTGIQRSCNITISGEGVDPIVIAVTQEQQCDWFSNIKGTDVKTYAYGQDRDYDINTYAEKFTNTKEITIDSISVLLYKLESNSPTTSTVKFSIYNEIDNLPGTSLGSKTVTYSDLTVNVYNDIAFDSPIAVNGNYYIVLELSNVPTTDTLCIYSTGDRDAALNTAYLMYQETWYKTGDLYDNGHNSLYIYSKACEKAEDFCPAPTNLEATPTVNSINLSWTAASGVSSYEVYRDNVSIGTAATNSYSDATAIGGTNYCYTVKSVCGSDKSLASNQACTKINVYTITTTQAANGTISPSGVMYYNAGSTPTYTITADANYKIHNIIVNGNSVGSTSPYTFPAINANMTITANFITESTETFTIDASVNDTLYGSITPSGEVSVISGEDQSFTISANTGYTLSELLVDGIDVINSLNNNTYTFSDVTVNHTILANFVAVNHTITATAGANGTITPSGNVTVPDGSNMTFTITPAQNYKIATVYVDNTDVTSSLVNNTYIFENVTTDHSIIATFDENSIDEVNLNNIEIYPNPVSGILNIVSNEMIEVVEIYSIGGQLIDKISSDRSKVMYNTETLSNGIYFCKIKTSDSIIVKKFTLEK